MKIKIKLKGYKEENFNDYKKVGFFLAFPSCNWKCLKELNLDLSISQNSHLIKEETQKYNIKMLLKKNKNKKNCGGLEPFDTFDDLLLLAKEFRKQFQDDIVIYTGYYEDELQDKISKLKEYANIYIKFGRYNPNLPSRNDDVLGIKLASNNQYGKQIS